MTAVLSSVRDANRANDGTKSGVERSSLIRGCRGWPVRVVLEESQMWQLHGRVSLTMPRARRLVAQEVPLRLD